MTIGVVRFKTLKYILLSYLSTSYLSTFYYRLAIGTMNCPFRIKLMMHNYNIFCVRTVILRLYAFFTTHYYICIFDPPKFQCSTCDLKFWPINDTSFSSTKFTKGPPQLTSSKKGEGGFEIWKNPNFIITFRYKIPTFLSVRTKFE